ncbi:MAG: HNH endonuclease signature motif containing protein [Candidatus Peregrinibacteria bacterium]|nr:HNH endonuclease signature motif containing protein [Candidatus Peregrinibacteria bacterium]
MNNQKSGELRAKNDLHKSNEIVRKNDFSATKELHKKFISLGNQRNKITHELILLIPEIYKKEIYKSYGCANIYEYAARFGGGLSAGVVDKVIKVEKKLSEVSCQNLFETVREQGVHKVAMVACFATKENEKELIKVVENLPKAAVQEYSREMRGKISRAPMKIELDGVMRYQLEKMKQKMKVQSNKEILKRLIQAQFDHFFPGENFEEVEDDGEIAEVVSSGAEAVDRGAETVDGGAEAMGCGAELVVMDGAVVNCWDVVADEVVNREAKAVKKSKKITRYIPKQKRTETLTKTGGRCSSPNCERPATEFHHENGYAKTKSHDNLIALCKLHHKIIHAGIYREPTKTDLLYLEHRKLALE